MSTRTKLLKRIFLLVILPIAVATTSFLFLRNDSTKQRIYDRPLREALTRKDLKTVKYLVERGAEVNTTVIVSQTLTTVYMTPIKLAVLREDVPATRYFLQKGAHAWYVEPVPLPAPFWIKKMEFTGFNSDDMPLCIAIKGEHESMIKMLIEQKIQLNVNAWNGFTPYTLLESSCTKKPTPKCQRILKMMKEAGAKDMPDE